MDAAEEIVGDAWVQVLIEHRDRAEAAMLAASAHCDQVRRVLASALIDRDPSGIAAAHSALEDALAAVRQTTRACEQAREGLIHELDQSAWKAIERRVDACIAGDDGTTSAVVPAEGRRHSKSRVQNRSLLVQIFRRVVAWLVFVVTSLGGSVSASRRDQ